MRFLIVPRLLFRMVLLLSIVLGGLFAGAQPGARAQVVGGLFSAAPDQAALPRRDDVIRSRLVRADLSQIAGQDGRQPADRLTLNLFDDLVYTAIRRESSLLGPGRFSWVGDLEGTAEGEITLAVDGGVLAAGVQVGADFYAVRSAGDQLYSIDMLHRNDTRDGLEPLIPPASALPAGAPSQPEAAPSQAPTGETIDVMVLYTPKARIAAGGTTPMNSLVDLAIADTNTAYANSNVSQRLRLVYKGEISHTEANTGNAQNDFGTDLRLLTYKAGSSQDPAGVIDSVHTLRDTHHADLVALLADYSGGICGLAWLMQTNSVGFAPYGFSVVNWDCAVAPQNSFAHELGHNMGLDHDKETADMIDSQGVFPYAYGYRVPGKFRTIMAYNCSPSCPRVRHFSNPNVLYKPSETDPPMPTGTAANSASPAFNAQALDNTANTVALFRTAPVNVTDRVFMPRIRR